MEVSDHKMNQLFKVGYVTARRPEKHRVKVEIRDTVKKTLVTKFLPVLVPCACSDLHFDLPAIGDEVLCCFLPNGLEQGFVIGSLYGKQDPPVKEADKFHRLFKDGTFIEYDKENHKLTCDVKGDVEIICKGNFTINSKGNVKIQGGGSMDVQAGIIRIN